MHNKSENKGKSNLGFSISSRRVEVFSREVAKSKYAGLVCFMLAKDIPRNVASLLHHFGVAHFLFLSLKNEK